MKRNVKVLSLVILTVVLLVVGAGTAGAGSTDLLACWGNSCPPGGVETE